MSYMLVDVTLMPVAGLTSEAGQMMVVFLVLVLVLPVPVLLPVLVLIPVSIPVSVAASVAASVPVPMLEPRPLGVGSQKPGYPKNPHHGHQQARPAVSL